MKMLTEQQAYVAMFQYLEKLYERTKSDDLGEFLGDMSRLENGRAADPGVIDDWAQAVELALEGGSAEKIVRASNWGICGNPQKETSLINKE